MKKILNLLLVTFFAVAPLAQGAEPLTEEAEFVQKMGDQAIEILRNNKDLKTRRAKFRDLFEDYFAIPTIAKAVLSKHWKKATPEQQEEFVQLFKEKTFNIYTARLQNYANQNFSVTGSKQINAQTFAVSSVVKSDNDKDVTLVWNVGHDQKNGLYRIVDVKVEGISQVATQRSEYANILTNKGVDGLLEELRSAKQD